MIAYGGECARTLVNVEEEKSHVDRDPEREIIFGHV